MNAIVFGAAGKEELRVVPVPRPGRGEVLLKVHYCGICGSDLHAAAPDFRTGVTMGHEFAGEVVDVGPGVDGWSAGDRACVNPNAGWCGACAQCRAGAYNLCSAIWDTVVGLARHGGMAPYAAVPARTLQRLPDEVTSLQGAWVEPVAVATRSVKRSGIGRDEPAVVFGCGPIGLLVIQVLRVAGAGRITAVEPSPARAALARDLGADDVLDPRRDDARDAPAYAFDCTGVASVTETALRVLGPRGTLVVTGFAREKPCFPSEDLLFKELTVRGSFIYVDEFPVALELLGSGAIDVEALTSSVVPVERGLEAFAAMRRSGDTVKVLLRLRPRTD